MALVFNNAGNPAGIPVSENLDAVFEMKEAMKAAGFVVPSSGTGTAGSYATSDLIAASSDLNTNYAWFIVRGHGGREWCFQRILNNASFRIKYSLSGFNAGSPSAAQVPSSTDEVVLLGSGTDASPGGVPFGTATSTTRIIHMAVDDAGDGWYCCVYITGMARSFVIFSEPLIPGSFDPTDLDPYIQGAFSGSWTNTTFSTTGTACRTLFANTDYVNVWAALMTGWGNTATRFPAAAGAYALTGNDVDFPMIWGRRPDIAAPVGYKGISRHLTLAGSSRTDGEPYSKDSSNDRVVTGGGTLHLPWNGTVPATV